MELCQTILCEFDRWLMNATDPEQQQLLKDLKKSEDEIFECFYTELEFGTGGIRGILGTGTNRMNIYTVGRTTLGLGNMLIKKQIENPKVAIGYDSRNKSKEFAEISAQILASKGIKAYIYPCLMPTPCVSYAVRQLKCDGGIMITASHNPGKYNGYKVFGDDGCQMNIDDSKIVMDEIKKLDFFDIGDLNSFEDYIEKGLIEYISDNVNKRFINDVLSRRINPDLISQSDLKITYTPLNGAGNIPVRTALSLAGIKPENLHIVKEQELPDGDFPTCPFPNPEIKQALEKGLELCKIENCDLLLATDPDCDRVGIAVKNNDSQDEYTLMSGNEVGILLTDYLMRERTKKQTLPKNPIIVKTIVTSPLLNLVAESYGANVTDVLTGFKFIGEQIKLLEKKGEEERFIIGFEESYGYLTGTYVRDKDAVVASVLICEMAAFYKKQNKTIVDAMNDIYEKFGFYKSSQDNLYFEGSDGMTKMKNIILAFQENPPKKIGDFNVVSFSDYQKSLKINLTNNNQELINLPKSDVVVMALENNCEIIVRPSGTEPKIKIYYTSVGKTSQESDSLAKILQKEMNEIIKSKGENKCQI